MNMTSGVKFDETYNVPGNDIPVFSRPWARPEGSNQDVIQMFRDVGPRPGERFNYLSSDACALALALAKAIGRPLSDHVCKKTGAPMAAEADADADVEWMVDAEWMVDPRGTEAA